MTGKSFLQVTIKTEARFERIIRLNHMKPQTKNKGNFRKLFHLLILKKLLDIRTN